MKTLTVVLCLGLIGTRAVSAAPPALTIYNQNFAVVRDTVPLDLKAGVTPTRFADVTSQVEPDSVILRDPAGNNAFQILEQNYRSDAVSQDFLLSLFEGKTIQFEDVHDSNGAPVRELISGKVIRSGYLPGGGAEQPIIQVADRLRFSLPGTPLFPDLGDDTILRPTLHWQLQSEKAAKFDAEISYVTSGLNWEASYNLVSPEKGEALDLIGWVTMNNQSGKVFRDAKIKLLAGDVNRIPRPEQMLRARAGGWGGGGGAPVVTEKTFDEYHLYTLARPATLNDRQMKQVEFVRATGVKSQFIYVYDGVASDVRFSGSVNQDNNYGTQSQKKVWVLREFANTAANQLGLPLPKGRMRFYRRDDDGQLEFIGENEIDHTPRDEMIRVRTGNSFDLVGERKQTDFKLNFFPPIIDPATGMPVAPPPSNKKAPARPSLEESFEIKLNNHKKQPVEIRVVEHLYRWSNWQITRKSDDFKKTDAQTIEFRVRLKPDEEKNVTYTVAYTW